MNEFGFIANHLSLLAGEEALGLKDDAALWSPPSGLDVVISMDTICEGVHFPKGQFDERLAQKLLRVNISDIIAKGADPVGYGMSLYLSEHIGEQALKLFCQGLKQDQNLYKIKLWGGDTVRGTGPVVLGLTLFGTLPKGTMVPRGGAVPGDILCISGTVGDAYLGLKAVMGEIDRAKYNTKLWEDVYHIPMPPFDWRRHVRKHASAALDVSDGLLADARHLAKASNAGVEIDLHKIPLSPFTRQWALDQPSQQQALLALASGGDDYQVLMSMSKNNYKRACTAKMPITKIGKITNGQGLECVDKNGTAIEIKNFGYTHF